MQRTPSGRYPGLKLIHRENLGRGATNKDPVEMLSFFICPYFQDIGGCFFPLSNQKRTCFPPIFQIFVAKEYFLEIMVKCLLKDKSELE
jgi:hypothetical protein